MNQVVVLQVRVKVTMIANEALVGSMILLSMAFGGHKRAVTQIVLGKPMLKPPLPQKKRSYL
jgi:hypothetical protein